MKYKIYKLIYQGEIVYVGRTMRSLKERKKSGYKGTCVQDISDDCVMELIEETNDVSREKYWIDEIKKTSNLLNKRGGNTGLSDKEWRKNNKELIRQLDKEWRKNNKESLKIRRKEYNKEYSEKNKDRLKEYYKTRYQKKKLTNT